MALDTPAFSRAAAAKRDTDDFLDALKRGVSAKQLKRFMGGSQLPPRPAPVRPQPRRRARSARGERELRTDVYTERRIAVLEQEMEKAKAREAGTRRRMQTVSAATTGLREQVANQQARVLSLEQEQKRKAHADATAAAMARALKTRLDELAQHVSEQDENVRVENGRLLERFAKLQCRHALLGKEQQQLATSVADLRTLTPAWSGGDQTPREPLLPIAPPLALATGDGTSSSSRSSSVPPPTPGGGAGLPLTSDLEPPLRAPTDLATTATCQAAATAASPASAAHDAYSSACAAPSSAHARAHAAHAKPPPPPHVVISREQCESFLARHARTCASGRPYVKTLCEEYSSFESSLRRAGAPPGSRREVPSPRAPSARAPQPQPQPQPQPEVAKPSKGRGKAQRRSSRQRRRPAAAPSAAAAPAPAPARPRSARCGDGATSSAAVAYDDDDSDDEPPPPSATPLSVAASRVRELRGGSALGRARNDDDDDDDDFGSAGTGRWRQRFRGGSGR